MIGVTIISGFSYVWLFLRNSMSLGAAVAVVLNTITYSTSLFRLSFHQ